MGAGYLISPLEFLISTLFDLYVLAIMLRTLLAWVRADFYNPVSQFLVKITNPPLLPLRRLIPPLGRIDSAAIVLMLLVQMAAVALILLLRGGAFSPWTLLVVSIAELVSLLFNVFVFSIIIQAILSWVNPGAYNPVTALLHALNEPVLRPARRLLPPIGGLDLSPLLALIALQVLKMLVLPLFRLLL
ncbi:YggT family protein [Thiohalobacter sp. IOR34]|uniref:YggT family protein n=1 Tax=Thiohalobacter sp. IOR34 TaxID=3057176 RepID=UPI0025AF2A0A|nr:YggT family protein [Thiohalobacter sp. IOR34]WJW75776.1 YggT family protein [Thiohalobacter sp. IOR34]